MLLDYSSLLANVSETERETFQMPGIAGAFLRAWRSVSSLKQSVTAKTMEKLVQGVARFRSEGFRDNQALFSELAKGQKPEVLFITCSDSRIDPNLLTQTAPGELFVIRNAGNIVPRYGAVEGGESATIEYAVKVLGVKDVVICGHSHCGAMAGMNDPSQLGALPAVRSWLVNSEEAAQKMADQYADLEDPALRLEKAVELNVLAQLNNLKTHPSVASGLEAGTLGLHGWTYQFEEGNVRVYDAVSGDFKSLGA